MLVPEEVPTLIERFVREKKGDWLKHRAKPGDVPVPFEVKGHIPYFLAKGFPYLCASVHAVSHQHTSSPA